jgi:hypothetical protein
MRIESSDRIIIRLAKKPEPSGGTGFFIDSTTESSCSGEVSFLPAHLRTNISRAMFVSMANSE